MDRNQKEQTVASLRSELSESTIVLMMKQKGLTVAESTDLRRKIAASGSRIRVVKNTLARLAVAGTDFESLESMLSGPTIMAYSSDPVAPAKVIATFANSNDKLEILGAVFNKAVLKKADVINLSKLPSLDELRGKLIGVIQAPAQRMACITSAPAAQLARVFSAYAKKA